MHGSIRFAGLFAAARVAALILAWPLLPDSAATAHRVDVLAWIDGDAVTVKGTYAGGRPVTGGQVEVFDPSGGRLLQGETDESGLFSFARPPQTDLRVVLTAAPGHQGECQLRNSDAPGIRPNQGGHSEGGDPERLIKEALTPERISEAIVKALDARLSSMERRVAALEEKRGPGIPEILGGIGYIVGLMGVALYFRSRRRG